MSSSPPSWREFVSGKLRFTCHQVLSIVCVCARVSGSANNQQHRHIINNSSLHLRSPIPGVTYRSLHLFHILTTMVVPTKLYWWLTVRWCQPSSSSWSYARQQSVMTVESLLTCRSIMSISVEASRLLSGQTARKISPVSLQIPPTTHWPSTNLPLLYFLFPNLLSSTSTVSPNPPISFGVSRATVSKQTSRQYDSQSATVAELNLLSHESWHSCMICSYAVIFAENTYTITKTCSSDRLLLSKKVPSRIDMYCFLQFLLWQWNTTGVLWSWRGSDRSSNSRRQLGHLRLLLSNFNSQQKLC